MVHSRFGHSVVVVDDFCAEAEALKLAWKPILELGVEAFEKFHLNEFYERLDKATASGPYIDQRCRDAKQELLAIFGLLKAKLKAVPIFSFTTDSGTEYVTEAMMTAGYESIRDAIGERLRDWCAGHPTQVYVAMRMAASPAIKHVFIPENADEAEAMLRTGYAWLKGNAPERLKEEAQQAPQPDPKDNQAYAETVRQMHRPLTNDDHILLNKALDASTTDEYELDPVRLTSEEQKRVADYLEKNPEALYEIEPDLPLAELKRAARRMAKKIIVMAVSDSDEEHTEKNWQPEINAGMELILSVIRYRVGGNIHQKIDTWSMRPDPESATGIAWEAGAKQGYQWALDEINFPKSQSKEA